MLHQVGVGALGPVFRTYEPTRDRLVAVKVFRLDITPEQAQALADELSVAAQAGLFHPSIVEPIAAGIEGSVAYRAEEYVAAESLDVAMRHYAPATIDKVLPFISQLAAGVDFARMAGVGHGALHPRDIWVTPEEARATGFGVVEALERVGLRAPVRRPYSAPERVAGEKWGTPADVFSLGAIAYELLTGRRPAGVGSGIGDLSGASLAGHATAVNAVLVRAMEENPAARFPTAMAFASALESASRGEAIPAAVPSVSVPVASASRRKPQEEGASASRRKPQEEEVASAPDPVVSARDPVASAFRRKEQKTPKPQPPKADEPDVDDITPEQHEDEADYALTLEEREAEAARDEVDERDLFDVEAVEDLALDRPSERFANDFNPAVLDELPQRQPLERTFERELEPESDTDDAAAGYVPPPRRSIDYVPVEEPLGMMRPPHRRTLPLALMLLLGLLIGFGAGFGAGYGVGSRATATPEATQTETGDKPPSEGTPANTPGGKAYSEQDVKPPAQAPPVPGDAPPASATAPADKPAPGTAPVDKPVPGTAPVDKPAPSSGRIIVRSVPSNAGVTVDGTWRGRTPLTLDKVRLGNHEVRVVQPGFAVSKESVSLTPAAPARTLSFRLQPTGAAPSASSKAPADKSVSAPAPTAKPVPNRSGLPPVAAEPSGPGSLYIDSRPRGAIVFLDGRQIGVTPATIPDVTSGAHVIRLELVDHRPWTANSQVLPGQQTRVTGSLERIR